MPEDLITRLAKKGRAGYAAKKAAMVTNYQAAIGRAVESYRSIGFGGAMTRAYEAGMAIGKQNYTAERLDEGRWEARWVQAANAGTEETPKMPPPPPAAPPTTPPEAPAVPLTKTRKATKSEFDAALTAVSGTSGAEIEESEQESQPEGPS